VKELTITECRLGFDAAFENGKRFYDDALYIEKAGRLLSSALLAIYVYDELGKAALIARTALRQDQNTVTWQEFHKEFRAHAPKIEAIQKLLNLFQGGFFLDDSMFQKTVKDLANQVLKLRTNVAFVELANNKFSKPSAKLNKDCKRLIGKVGMAMELMARIQGKIHRMLDEAEVR